MAVGMETRYTEGWSNVEHVYGELLHRHLVATRKGDEPRRVGLFKLIEAIEAEWPEDTARWNERFCERTVDG